MPAAKCHSRSQCGHSSKRKLLRAAACSSSARRSSRSRSVGATHQLRRRLIARQSCLSDGTSSAAAVKGARQPGQGAEAAPSLCALASTRRPQPPQKVWPQGRVRGRCGGERQMAHSSAPGILLPLLSAVLADFNIATSGVA